MMLTPDAAGKAVAYPMVEVMFSSSAAASLMQAAHFGKGRFNEENVAAFFSGGSTAAEAEHAARRMAMERAREQWEKAAPLDVKREDVYALPLALSMGDIREAVPGEERIRLFCELCSVFPPDDMEERVRGQVEDATHALEEVRRRTASGEEVRVWYSNNPDEMCGFYWLMAQLSENCGGIHLVKLPEWEYTDGGSVEMKNGWGEVAPGEWGRYAALSQTVDMVFRRKCALVWKRLKKENAPLRALVNGQVVSVSEEFYDGFIRDEIAGAEEAFRETDIILGMLHRHLGLGDAWIALRIDAMIAGGELAAVTEAPEGHPSYRRILRKAGSDTGRTEN